jgi:hypothetical protein
VRAFTRDYVVHQSHKKVPAQIPHSGSITPKFWELGSWLMCTRYLCRHASRPARSTARLKKQVHVDQMKNAREPAYITRTNTLQTFCSKDLQLTPAEGCGRHQSGLHKALEQGARSAIPRRCLLNQRHGHWTPIVLINVCLFLCLSCTLCRARLLFEW